MIVRIGGQAACAVDADQAAGTPHSEALGITKTPNQSSMSHDPKGFQAVVLRMRVSLNLDAVRAEISVLGI